MIQPRFTCFFSTPKDKKLEKLNIVKHCLTKSLTFHLLRKRLIAGPDIITRDFSIPGSFRHPGGLSRHASEIIEKKNFSDQNENKTHDNVNRPKSFPANSGVNEDY